MKKIAKDILSPYLIKYFNVNADKFFDIEYVSPQAYLCPQRLDLVSKLIYIESRLKNQNKFFAKEFYRTYTRAFLSYDYNDLGTIGKNSFKKHLILFNNLIDSVVEKGIDSRISTLVAGKDNVIADGAHRLSVALYLNKRIPVLNISNFVVNHNYHFFLFNGIDNYYLDYTVLKYIYFSKKTTVLCCSCEIKQSVLKIKSLINYLVKNKVIYERQLNSKNKKLVGKYSFLYVLDNLSQEEYKKIKQQTKSILNNERSYIKLSINSEDAEIMAEEFLNNVKIIRFFDFIYKTIYGWLMDFFKIRIVNNNARIKLLEEKEYIAFNLKDIPGEILYEIKKQYFNDLLNSIKFFTRPKSRNYKFYNICVKNLSMCYDNEIKNFISQDDYSFYMYVKYFPKEFWRKITK